MPIVTGLQVDDLEAKLKDFKANATWMDAPVENAHLFHRRFTKFMTHWITRKTKQGGLLGRVKHWFVRYEVQGRGSCECKPLASMPILHAHMCTACISLQYTLTLYFGFTLTTSMQPPTASSPPFRESTHQTNNGPRLQTQTTLTKTSFNSS